MNILKKLYGPLSPKEFWLTVALAFFLCAFFLSIAGCEQSLRFAPSEAQKEAAELTHDLAAKVNSEGASPRSPATLQLEQGTQVALAYIGRPKEPPDVGRFRTIAAAAAADSVKRPDVGDVFDAVDQGLSLATEIAILFGVGASGFGGKKLLDWIRLARAKTKALEEIIEGNEAFKTKARIDQAAINKFKDAQDANQSAQTKMIVTKLKG